MHRIPQPPRNNLEPRREPRFELGARHDVSDLDAAQFLFVDLDQAFAGVIPEEETRPEVFFSNDIEGDEPDIEYGATKYTLYNRRSSLGLTVLEKHFAAEQAKSSHKGWGSKGDIGRVRGEIEDRISREIPRGDIEVMLTDILPVSGPKSRKLAAIVERGSDAAEILIKEHEIVWDVLSQALAPHEPNKRHNPSKSREIKPPHQGDGGYVPKLTLGRIHSGRVRIYNPLTGQEELKETVTDQEFKACIEAARLVLPRPITVSSLRLYS